MQIMRTPCFERYVGQPSNELPALHDRAYGASAQQRPSFRTGVLGAAVIDTTKESWALLDGRTEGKREGLAVLALAHPKEYGEFS
jgi:hypothetical protein